MITRKRECTRMKILHTSHTGLPDPRIEKTAATMGKDGHELIFLGGRPIQEYGLPVFRETHHIPIVNFLKLALDSSFKAKWLKKIDEIKPDVVHAHNIIAASMMLETDYPVIYDDHEYWSKGSYRFGKRGIIRKAAMIPFDRKVPKWEEQILERYPVITVNENIARDHRRIAKRVGVTKNFPILDEVKYLQNPEQRDGNVYVGSDFNLREFVPHRNMTGLKDIINFDILSGLKHSTMMDRLTHFRIGLTPWRHHPFHVYCEPNKHYEYLVAGLQVILTSSLAHPFPDEPYVHSFESYSEIPGLLEQIEIVESGKIMRHAQERYVWEKQEDVIKDMYKSV